MVYTMLRLGGRSVGGLYRLNASLPGAPPNWMSYVSVRSAAGTAERARELGGAVIQDAFDVMELGRMAVLQDPVGALFCVWEPLGTQGAEVRDEPGAFCWNELSAGNTAKAGPFYEGLFGWTRQEIALPHPYTRFLLGGREVAGMYPLPPEQAEAMPASWMVYFAVTDCDGSARTAERLGGSVHVGPQDIPGVGRFAMLRDPQGAWFSIIRLLQP
jgi:predicted enzyme related to lactoylglutathione lyase